MAATTSFCSTKKESVPEMCMPSSWRWPMRKYDLWPLFRLPIKQPVLFFFTVFLFSRQLEKFFVSLLTILTDSVKRALNEGRTRKKKKGIFFGVGGGLYGKVVGWRYEQWIRFHRPALRDTDDFLLNKTQGEYKRQSYFLKGQLAAF